MTVYTWWLRPSRCSVESDVRMSKSEHSSCHWVWRILFYVPCNGTAHRNSQCWTAWMWTVPNPLPPPPSPLPFQDDFVWTSGDSVGSDYVLQLLWAPVPGLWLSQVTYHLKASVFSPVQWALYYSSELNETAYVFTHLSINGKYYQVYF